MKKRKSVSVGLLLGSLLLSLPVQGAGEIQYAVSLDAKAGVLEKTGADLRFNSSGLLLTGEDGKTGILDPFGEDRLGKAFDQVEAYGDKEGLFLVAEYEAMPNALSLVKTDGTVLVDHAAIIRTAGRGSSRRYAEVTFATDEVSSEEDCFLFSYKADAMIDVQLTPGEGDTMYAGYSRVFDTLEERFVDNVQIDNVRDSVTIVGENILVHHSSTDTEDELYRPDGSLVGTVDASTEKAGDYLVSKAQDEEYLVLDENLAELAQLDFRPGSIYANGTLFTISGEKPYRLVDADGNEVSPLAFAQTPAEDDPFLIGYDSDNNFAVMSTDGSTILDFSEEARNVTDIACGIHSVSYKSGDYGILYPDGRLFRVKNPLRSSLLTYTTGEQNKCDEIWILNQAQSVKASDLGLDGWIDEVGPMTFAFKTENGHGLYSSADGGMLISPDEGYTGFSYSDGYIYAEGENAWDVFPCTISEDR